MKSERAGVNKKIWPLLLLLVALSACASDTPPSSAPANSASAPAPSNANAAANTPKSPLEGIVQASADNLEVRAGETKEAAVRLAIQSGYHVNANPATERFLIPTSLEVKPEAGIAVDKIIYPKPLTKKFPFAEVPPSTKATRASR